METNISTLTTTSNPNRITKPVIDLWTSRLHIRSVREEDKDAYMALRTQTSMISAAYNSLPDFADREWKSELNHPDDIYLSVFQEPGHVFIASASLQGFHRDVIEFGLDVDEFYREKGYGVEVLLALLHIAHTHFPEASLIAKTAGDNIPCQKLSEKCGGRLIRKERSEYIKKLDELTQQLEDGILTDSIKDLVKRNRQYIQENKDEIYVYRFA